MTRLSCVSKINLAPNIIHLWIVDQNDVDKQLQTDYFSILSREEVEQQRRFYFEKYRRRYLITWALVRTVLSRYASVAPCDWHFSKNVFGRPQITEKVKTAADLNFNLSHTQDLIVLAVARKCILGVDVEYVSRRGAIMEVADRFFAPEEVGALGMLTGALQQDRFFEYWTLKESYIKARGLGLSLPLDRFCFDLSQAGAISFSVDTDLGDWASQWRFWQLRLWDTFIVAICAQRITEHATRIVITKTVPMLWDERLHVGLSRTSA